MRKNSWWLFVNKRELKFKIPFYPQVLSMSCGAACIQMIGNFFNPKRFPLTYELQIKIHERIRFWDTDEYGELESIAKMLRWVRKNGLRAKYYFESHDNLSEAPLGVNKELWGRYIRSFYRVLEEEKGKGLFVSDECDIKNIYEEIRKGHPVVCEIQHGNFVTHDIVVRGFKDKMFYIIDPLRGYERMLRDDLIEKIDLGYMKNFFSLSPPE
ncbi:MAG: hypothetical protein GF370_02795 [Candidatus Nealsonbacteria bacterium]|nr:hypothetical protein [Candidatus Nealsonbacteria bacterium]